MPPVSESAIRRLTAAIWVLIVMTALNIVVSLYPSLMARRVADSFTGAATSTMLEDRYAGFSDWPLERQLTEASAIAIARYEKDGRRYKAVISEILKKDPNVELHYKVGDEYARGSYYPKQGVTRGDGLMIFFTGSPASMRMSFSFSGDRLGGLGDMPLEEIRRLINEK